MLDKSIPYKNIIMRKEGRSPSFFWEIPNGFRIRTYAPGDEKEWAAIEASVGEFDTAAEAEQYFIETYLPYPEEISRRCFFVLSPSNVYAGTCIAWYIRKTGGETGVIHWFGVRPEYQGLGVGKALLTECLRLFAASNAYPAWLHTQTWSHKAIGLYHAAGFRMLKSGTFDNNPNDYLEAVEILKTAVSAQRLKEWTETAV
jgi:ribosomal protein S18 acetylase RimI-like enzyme